MKGLANEVALKALSFDLLSNSTWQFRSSNVSGSSDCSENGFTNGGLDRAECLHFRCPLSFRSFLTCTFPTNMSSVTFVGKFFIGASTITDPAVMTW